MKRTTVLSVIVLMGFFVIIAQPYPKKALLLSCQGNETFCRDNPRPAQIFSLREEMESLIREGNIPIVIECEKNVAWIYLNDPMGRDYPEVNFESDYFEILLNLFPLKINKELKKSLKQGNRAFIEALGIEYRVEDGEVTSLIDYDKFENFVF